ncbi:predicted protein [Sparassis crispa]|uniref:RlpA-like protein double-psi beta-barrel domain-containing protein n=1 Tax=Sparassis crispa TaxID=139825 RepID=A0A401GBK1_9APHY|nr:predicted protein [Sparassis crispa]GBE79566.1 predicted protein [Sparassis crispa]
MIHLFSLSSLLFAASTLAPLIMGATAADISAFQSALERRYSTAHTLAPNYQFDPRDGWQTVNVTNLQYKYARENQDEGYVGERMLERRVTKKPTAKTSSASKPKSTSASKSSSGGVVDSLSKVVQSLKAIGSAQPVTITWYTGKDLLNPSCWEKPTWHPTDDSFACALTLEGWTDRPACFKFLELCNTPKKCVFVRVVDSCAGCAPGSKHVDLTKSAFTQLADLGEGVLTVQMRSATNPDGWLQNLWGPQEN